VLILHYELHLILRSLLQLPLFQSDVSSPSYGLLSAPALAWPSPQARLVLLLLSWQAANRSTCVYALDLLQISMRMKLDDQKEYPCAVLHVFTVSPVASSLLAPFFSLTRPMCMIQGSDPTKTNTWNSLRPFPGPFGVIPSVFLLLLR
jgi:hypothetical protein